MCTGYTFKIYILLHIKRQYFIHSCLFLKSSKAFSVSLRGQLCQKNNQAFSFLKKWLFGGSTAALKTFQTFLFLQMVQITIRHSFPEILRSFRPDLRELGAANYQNLSKTTFFWSSCVHTNSSLVLVVLYYRATWASLKLKLEKIKKIDPKKFLILRE